MNKWLLVAIWIVLVLSIREPDILTEVKRRYSILREELIRTGRFKCIQHKVIVTGMYGQAMNGDIGYNVNKGYEIFLCLKGGDVNGVMHVLLHELAHITVTEYDHSSKFWNNLDQIKDIAKRLQIYEAVKDQPFCDGIISD